MLEVAILGLLKQQPMHGYQLSRELGESLGGFWRVSYGSLYPTLRRLERDGLVSPEPASPRAAVARPSTASPTRARRAFLELLQETPADSSSRGRPVPRAPRVLPVPAARDADPAAGAPARVPRGAARARSTTRSGAGRARGRRLHARPGGARPCGHRVRHRLARRPDPSRTGEDRRAGRPRTRGSEDAPLGGPQQEGAHLMSTVRIAIVGVGNCASSLVQGLDLLRGRRSRRPRAGPDARGPRRVPRARRRGGRRLRRRREEGREATSPRRSSPSRTTRSGSPTWRRSA